VKVEEVFLNRAALENFTGRFFLLVDRSSQGCWPWLGPRHSSGHGRYLWKAKDGGNDRYVFAHRISYFLSTGELPSYTRNLCGDHSCCKPSHWWTKPTGPWKRKARKATRGIVRRLPASDIERIRLLDSLGSDEDEIGQQFGLTKRQVREIAMGRVRPEAGGRIRGSRHRGIRYYHRQFEQSLDALRPDDVVPSTPQPLPDSEPASSTPATGRPFPFRSYGQPMGRRMPRYARW
jgi:hypothetical protein